MRKSILALFLCVLCLSGKAFADTTTANLGLTLPAIGQNDVWGGKLNTNFQLIDDSVTATSSTNTFTGTNSFTILKANQVLIATSTYPGTDKLAVNGTATFFGPTGGDIHLCDVGATNCTNLSLETSNPEKGIVVTTMTLTKLTAGDVSITTGTVSGPFTINSSSLSINSVQYNFPSSQGSAGTYPKNDGSGHITWFTPSGSGSVAVGTAGRLSLYGTSADSVADTYVQNTKNITIDIATQTSRSVNLTLTIPNPGNAVSAANVILSSGAAFTSEVSMGTHRITQLLNGIASTDAATYAQAISGKIIQIVTGVAAIHDVTNSTAFTSSSLTATISPSSASSRVLVFVFGSCDMTNVLSAETASYTVYRGGFELSGQLNGFFSFTNPTTNFHQYGGLSFALNDGPATTSATTYVMKFRTSDVSATAGFGNANSLGTMLLVEVGP